MAYTNDSIWKSVDWMTICIYLMLVIFGWFSVCGASYDYGEMIFLVSTLVQETICMDLLLFGARIYPDDVRG